MMRDLTSNPDLALRVLLSPGERIEVRASLA
jgi:hypothetical protein